MRTSPDASLYLSLLRPFSTTRVKTGNQSRVGEAPNVSHRIEREVKRTTNAMTNMEVIFRRKPTYRLIYLWHSSCVRMRRVCLFVEMQASHRSACSPSYLSLGRHAIVYETEQRRLHYSASVRSIDNNPQLRYGSSTTCRNLWQCPTYHFLT